MRELLDVTIPKQDISKPKKINHSDFQALIEFGGFPEPFVKQTSNFYRRWTTLRLEQLFHVDIRSLTRIQEIAQMKLLAKNNSRVSRFADQLYQFCQASKSQYRHYH